MSNLIKIRDVSVKYGISARTLRYYENMGLFNSTRGDDYAYRLYDEAAVKRLEQILILRKLNIGIKDIQRIFITAGSEVVLEVLGKKVDDIDEEVALLHELKEIVLSFIHQIEKVDFSKDSDVKSLYDKAKEIKTQLSSADYNGNPSIVNRLFEVTEKFEQKTVSRLSIPDNILKQKLQNVYFVLGDGAAVADELGRKYGFYVYHTCDNRYKHFKNADPRFQPGLCSFEENIPDFWSRDPEDAMRHERDIVRDFTPMVIMDLIQLTATHEKIICENDIDIDSIIPLVTHAVVISNDKTWEDFVDKYENEIRTRDISEAEKENLIRKVNVVWGKGKPENPRGTNLYGIKQIFMNHNSTVERTADMVAEYFGLPRAYCLGKKDEEMMYLAACGMNCSECASYRITRNNDLEAAKQSVEWYKEMGWIGEDDGPEAIVAKNPICHGCWDITEECFWQCGCGSIDFRVCCKEKGIKHCGECNDFPCEPYVAWIGDNPGHVKAFEHLMSLRANA